VVTSISLQSGKGKTNENRFRPCIAAAEQVAEDGAAGSCFVVTLITPQATEAVLMLDSDSAEGLLSKQAAPALESYLCRGYHRSPIAVGHAEKNSWCWNSFDN